MSFVESSQYGFVYRVNTQEWGKKMYSGEELEAQCRQHVQYSRLVEQPSLCQGQGCPFISV